jgi:hypothetical protein
MSADLQTDALTGVLMSDEDRSQPGADAAAGRSPASPSSLPSRFVRRLRLETTDATDRARSRLIGAFDRWPCADRKYLVVGSESSGTTAVGSFLFEGTPGIRYFRESKRQSWVWDAYKRIHQGQATIRDYPRLQLYDAIKVPGFAMIIEPFRDGFPNTRVIYMVRDPRDFVSSAFRTWSAQGVHDAAAIPWVTEDWLRLPSADPVERLCLRWRIYLQTAMRAGDVDFVRYEDFAADKVATIRDLAAGLGLPFSEERVMARKDEQVSRARDYAPAGPGAWRDTLVDDQVRTIERLCEDEMRRWRYLP